MLTPSGPKVLEYNVRFGDPETESLMLLLRKDVDLAAVFLVSTSFEQTIIMLIRRQACTEHRLDSVALDFQEGVAVTVILASKGYPGSYEKGQKITVGSLPQSS